MSKIIQLTQGKFALVDDEDYEEVNKHTWWATKNGNTWYARAWIKDCPLKNKRVSLHYFITGIKGIDHKDIDGLNNQKDNLRAATTKQQNANRGMPNKLNIKGVRETPAGAYRVAIYHDYGFTHLGVYETKKEAAEVYNEAVKIVYGEFAALNNIEEIANF